MAGQGALSVKCIPTGAAAGPKWMQFTHSCEQGVTPIAQYAWLIQGGRQNILVECGGIDDKDRLIDYGMSNIQMFEGNLQQSLKEEGLAPRDIDILIMTHLHGEHLIQAPEFENARILVQRKELQAALNPHPAIEYFYPE